MSTYIPMFTSPEGETEVMSTYEAIMKQWTVPYKELSISTSFGETHVIASGPESAPPVVLLHALLASAMSWYRNVETLSQSYRVYAVDVIGEGNKSRPIKPIAGRFSALVHRGDRWFGNQRLVSGWEFLWRFRRRLLRHETFRTDSQTGADRSSRDHLSDETVLHPHVHPQSNVRFFPKTPWGEAGHAQ